MNLDPLSTRHRPPARSREATKQPRSKTRAPYVMQSVAIMGLSSLLVQPSASVCARWSADGVQPRSNRSLSPTRARLLSPWLASPRLTEGGGGVKITTHHCATTKTDLRFSSSLVPCQHGQTVLASLGPGVPFLQPGHHITSPCPKGIDPPDRDQSSPNGPNSNSRGRQRPDNKDRYMRSSGPTHCLDVEPSCGYLHIPPPHR
jgi:hypothetical protein